MHCGPETLSIYGLSVQEETLHSVLYVVLRLWARQESFAGHAAIVSVEEQTLTEPVPLDIQ